VPEHDATVVARLRAAGAILLGKTNTPELTLAYETDNAIYGRTNNPYDQSRSCGGSSGGSAAILAVGGAPFEIGSDTGGSIRVPSHYCGTVGLRPTSGRVPRTGHILPPFGVLESLTSLGPMARHVEDLQLVLPIIAGPDGHDPAIVPMPLGDPAQVDLKKLRVAFHTHNGVADPTPETTAAVEQAAHWLTDAGLEVVEDRPPGIEQGVDLLFRLLGADGGAGVQALLQMYGTTQPHDFMTIVIQILQGYAISTAEFGSLTVQWDLFRSALLTFMDRYDIILCPVSASPAVQHGTSFAQEVFPGFSYTPPFNVTGWPVAVVRAGTSPEGLPIGVQIVARPWREDVALAVAQHLETACGRWPHPAL
jgi:amidase